MPKQHSEPETKIQNNYYTSWGTVLQWREWSTKSCHGRNTDM